MARVESVQLVDDLDGGAADETVSFSLEGSRWEIDLTAAHAAELRDALAPFVGAARRPSGASPRQTAPRAPRGTESTTGTREAGRDEVSAPARGPEKPSATGPFDLSGLFKEASPA